MEDLYTKYYKTMFKEIEKKHTHTEINEKTSIVQRLCACVGSHMLSHVQLYATP